jgi:hypothetical protein
VQKELPIRKVPPALDCARHKVTKGDGNFIHQEYGGVARRCVPSRSGGQYA